jgi:porin
LRTRSLLLLLATSLSAAAQSGGLSAAPAPQLSQPSQVKQPTPVKQDTDELRQQLDADSATLSKIPADPLIQPDPLGREEDEDNVGWEYGQPRETGGGSHPRNDRGRP